MEENYAKFWDEYLEQEFGLSYEECLEKFFNGDEYEDWIM